MNIAQLGVLPQIFQRGSRWLASSRGSNAPEILFLEDFKAPVLGMYNDGVGSAARDCEIMFDGCPSVRLDTQGNSTGAQTDPGSSPLTSGVVFKRRIHDSFSSKFGAECWVRFSSGNNTTNTLTCVSVYNRDGTNAHLGRIWLDTNAGTNNPLSVKYLNSGGTYTEILSIADQSHGANHMYDVKNGDYDKSGGWWYVKLVVDLENDEYVSIQVGDHFVDMAGVAIRQAASTGFKGMHFSVETAHETASRHYVNVAKVVGTREP